MNDNLAQQRYGGSRSNFGSTRDLLSLLFRRKSVFLAIFITIVSASVFSASKQVVSYVAEAKVLVTRGGGIHQGATQKLYKHWWEEMKTEMEVARSRPVAEIAAAQLARTYAERLQDESPDMAAVTLGPPNVDDLMGGRGVEVIDETDILRLTYRAATRSGAIEGVNALTRAYLAHSQDASAAPRASAFYSEYVGAAQSEVAELQATIASYKQQNSITDFSTQQIELTRQRNSIENQLITKRSQRVAKEHELASIQRSLASNPEVLVPSEEMKNDPNLAPYIRRLAELSGQLNSLLATYTRENPQVKAVERDVESCHVSIRKQVGHALVAKRTTLDVLRGEEQSYQTDIDRIDARLSELPALEAELGMMRVQLRNAEESLESLHVKSQEFEVANKGQPLGFRLSILSEAKRAVPVGGGARKQLFLVFSLILSAGLAFVAAFVVDMLDHSIKFPNDIEEALGVPMLASIREVPGAWSPDDASNEAAA